VNPVTLNLLFVFLRSVRKIPEDIPVIGIFCDILTTRIFKKIAIKKRVSVKMPGFAINHISAIQQ